GNVTASCVLATGDGAGRCTGMPTGGGGGPLPTHTLNYSVSGTADGTGAYPPGSIATISFSFVNQAEACVLLLDTGSTASPSWAGAINAFTPRTVTLSTASATYRFKTRCYNLGGAKDSENVVVISTNAGGGGCPPDCPPPTDQCTPAQQALADASHPGFTRLANPARITDMVTFANMACGDFPNSGSPVCLMLSQRGKYLAMQFTAPTDLSLYGAEGTTFIKWMQAQVGGEASTSRSYVTISKCQGDFTRPGDPAINSTDPTFSDGCRNIRGIFGTPSSILQINYNITGVSTNVSCGITPGHTYYLNYILADPREGGAQPGIQAGEHTCVTTSLNQCGLQINIQ
ncbi:MAG TPA: hypothetical protein VFL14_11810, partial [Xanthomonadales bacterium]|nr:hypothetical protein [Xanthomonadales bacterium]